MMNVFEDEAEIGRQIGIYGKYDPENLQSRIVECNGCYERSTLDKKVNQLILIAVCIAVNSSASIFLSHVKAFYEMGGSREDLQSTLNMCILAGGGPALAWAGAAMEQYDQLIAAKQ